MCGRCTLSLGDAMGGKEPNVTLRTNPSNETTLRRVAAVRRCEERASRLVATSGPMPTRDAAVIAVHQRDTSRKDTPEGGAGHDEESATTSLTK